MDTESSEDEADDIEHLPSRSDVLIAYATQEGTLNLSYTHRSLKIYSSFFKLKALQKNTIWQGSWH